MEKFQRFGGAMLMPVMLMPFAGLVIGIASVLSNADIVGSIAASGTNWYKFWTMMYDGGNAIFNQLPLVFVVSFPVGIVKDAKQRVPMEAFVIYVIYNYFISDLLKFWGSTFGVNFKQAIGGTSGLTTIAGIKTFNMSILGALMIAAIVAWCHNRWYTKKLPDYLSAFQGSALIVIIGTLLMIPLALITCFIWPFIEKGLIGMQGFLASSGDFGVGLYTFLEKLLVPTGLHHFLWVPFDLGPAVVPDGNWTHWLAHLNQYAASTKPVKSLFPSGGFSLYGNSAVFGIPAIALAMYKLSKPENKKRMAGMLIPITITAMLTGVTEPVEFSFLFVAPILFVIHAVLGAILAMTLYALGVVGYQGGGLIDYITYNWLPMLHNHLGMVITHIIVGLCFFAIYYFIFYYVIKRFNLQTPGREDSISTEDKSESHKDSTNDDSEEQAAKIIKALGGKDNIITVDNCMTRLRVNLKNPTIVASDADFLKTGAHGTIRKSNAIQVVIGTNVEELKLRIDKLL